MTNNVMLTEYHIMNESSNSISTRREFLKTTGRIALRPPWQEWLCQRSCCRQRFDPVALIGCGGRGQARLQTRSLPKRVHQVGSMADVFTTNSMTAMEA